MGVDTDTSRVEADLLAEQAPELAGDPKTVVFAVGEMKFGIDVGGVKEIIRSASLKPAHDGPDIISGILELRGMNLPVVDLQKRFFLKEIPAQKKDVLVIALLGHVIGFAVSADGDIEVVGAGVPAEVGELKEPLKDFCRGAVTVADEKILLLDIPGLFSDKNKKELFGPSSLKGKSAVL